MRSLLISLVLLVLSVQADDFKGQKVTLGKRKCTCDFRLDMKETCKGTAKCDKKCSGAGKVEVGGCSFALQVKKGNGKISKCTCQAAQPTIGPITGSGSGPQPPTGSGSGPSPPIGSGSGEQPVPLPGSGSGPGPQPPAGGEGMQCACKCDCPPGSGECDCDCNCPMNSQAVNCAPGFSKVCPMMGDQCPQSMEQVCPSMPTTMPMPAGRMMGAGDRGCQCVPDFLLSLVMGAMTPAGRSAAVDRAMTKVTFKIGKTTCKCQYDINEKDCKRSKFACDKKCNGKISGLELDGGNYVMNLMVKKGKVAIQKCEAKTTEPTGTGGGPGSGPGNGGGSGMGSGPGSGIGGGMGGMGTRCACVSMGGGPMPPTGSGSGPMPPTGSGPNPPTGSGSGSGPQPPTGSGSSQTVTVPERSWSYMTTDMEPTLGPEKDTVYQPGTPGAQWTDDEVKATRLRVFQMIHPVWDVKKKQGTWNGVGAVTTIGQTTENTLMRLVFHDCILHTDGTGGCDGCINWKGMNHAGPSANNKDDYYAWPVVNETDNNGMDQIVEKLELIYTTLDWPFQNASMEVSLYQSGKSRADLWQLAGLVALERTVERSNRACDLDYHARQQVTLLESREKCEIKLRKPLKFKTGRSDCISEDPLGRKYVTHKPEAQNMMFGDAKHVIDFGKDIFKIDSTHWTALQAIHGIVHSPKNLGLKYTWFGSGYLSNMYFKVIANKPRYRFDDGGDLSFGNTDNSANIFNTAVGDPDGNPVAQTGWRASCMMMWNTTEGGPCVLRPTPSNAFDSPNSDKMAVHNCVKGLDKKGKCIIRNTKQCKNVWCDERNVQHGAKLAAVDPEVVGPWKEDLPDKKYRHGSGWNNQFGFPWEIGLYWNFTVGGVAQRAIGCPGLDTPFGTITKPNWPYRNNKSPIFSSPAMDCNVNTYAPDGKPMHEIVDELANDNEYFAEKFLEGWQMFTENGNNPADLRDGPQAGWFGFYSLTEQGISIENFETYIAENSPVTFTDPNADPYICGHRGHSSISCGIRYSTGFKNGKFEGGGDEGPGF